MKLIVVVSAIILWTSSCTSNNDAGKQDERVTYRLSENTAVRFNVSSMEMFVSEFVDSIEKAKDETELPMLLQNPQFDYLYPGFWPAIHLPISVRAQIINRVAVCKGLILILDSREAGYKRHPEPEAGLEVPLGEFSLHDMVLERIRILDCNGVLPGSTDAPRDFRKK